MQQDDGSEDWKTPPESHSGSSIEVTDSPDKDVPKANENVASEVEDAVVNDDSSSEADEVLVRWSAPEYTHSVTSPLWFMVLGVVTLGLMAVAYFLMNSLTFTILLPVMAVALVIYVRRPAAYVDYAVSRKGVHVNDKLYLYADFRSFGVLSHNNQHSILLVPRKRFQLGQTLNFPEDVGEGLVDMLAARLPMQEVSPDLVDRLLAKLRL